MGEHKEEHKEEYKEEYKEEFNEEYKEDEEYKEEYNEEYKIKDEADDLDGESDYRNTAVVNDEEDIVDEKSLDTDIIAGTNFRFVCQKDLAKTLCSDWNRVGKKKDLPHVKTDRRPCKGRKGCKRLLCLPEKSEKHAHSSTSSKAV